MLDQMANEIKLISGSSHPELSALVASRYVACLRGPAVPTCGTVTRRDAAIGRTQWTAQSTVDRLTSH